MSKHVVVNVRQGKLRGVDLTDRNGVRFIAFRGIPYAKPPIDELRFKDPEPAEPWTGVRDASKFGHIPPQYDFFERKVVGDEDCLYLNVYTKKIDLETKRAVMVWIQGGSFQGGSGSYNFGPGYIVRKDVVLATVNFRLGVLGFLNLGNEIAPGNQGLKDALMALRWVHDNISNFGGDPENVTIFGHGFGGCIVHYLAMCPQAGDLFHKAISQSGTAANTWAFSEKEEQFAQCLLLVKELGKKITDLKFVVQFLKSIDAHVIVKGFLYILTTNVKRQLMFPFGPSEDFDSPNPFFVDHPATMLRSGVNVPFIVGFTSCEGSIFVQNMNDEALEQANSDFASIIHPNVWPTLEQNWITAEDVRFRYFGNEPVSMKTITNFISLIGDMHFYRGIFETISIQAQLGHRSTYVYKFSHEPNCWLPKLLIDFDFAGAIHGEELSYIFDPRLSDLRSELGFKVRDDPQKRRIIERITQMWTDFAKTGDPTPAITPTIPIKWTPLESEEEFNFLIIDNYLEMETMQMEGSRFFGVM